MFQDTGIFFWKNIEMYVVSNKQTNWIEEEQEGKIIKYRIISNNLD